MAAVSNWAVHELYESIYRSGYPMMTSAPTPEEFAEAVSEIERDAIMGNLDNKHIKRAINLANLKEGGHDQFLTGITVNFDLTLSNKAWVEAERYRWLCFISSMSTMHRASRLDIAECCNGYVSAEAIKEARYWQERYNLMANDPEVPPDHKLEAYRELLYSLPSGFELTAGMTTNYRSLKNIYAQRRTHRLPDWHVVCDWIETLPLAAYLITGECKKWEERMNA